MARIIAIDEILIEAPPDAAWRLVSDVDGYRHWWPPSIAVRVVERTSELTGTDLEIRPRRGFRFHCRIESVEAPTAIRLRYHDGPYVGTGVWRVTPTATGTSVVYRVDLRTSGPLLAVVGRVIDLGLVHSRLIRRILRGLDDALDGAPGSRPARARA